MVPEWAGRAAEAMCSGQTQVLWAARGSRTSRPTRGATHTTSRSSGLKEMLILRVGVSVLFFWLTHDPNSPVPVWSCC